MVAEADPAILSGPDLPHLQQVSDRKFTFILCTFYR